LDAGSIPAASTKINKPSSFIGWFFNFDAVDVNWIRGTRGEQGIRAACSEPANDIALASAMAGQDGRFPHHKPSRNTKTTVFGMKV
jgi:hypothetical protein